MRFEIQQYSYTRTHKQQLRNQNTILGLFIIIRLTYRFLFSFFSVSNEILRNRTTRAQRTKREVSLCLQNFRHDRTKQTGVAARTSGHGTGGKPSRATRERGKSARQTRRGAIVGTQFTDPRDCGSVLRVVRGLHVSGLARKHDNGTAPRGENHAKKLISPNIHPITVSRRPFVFFNILI